MSELKPCPFCGGADVIVGTGKLMGLDLVHCDRCGATFSSQPGADEWPKTGETLRAAWNRRSGEQP